MQPEGSRIPSVGSTHFADPAVVARYADGARSSVPGLAVVHELVDQILAESVPADGRVLVVGAGGGLELTHLAPRHTGWSFDGVDPSAEMLRVAKSTMGPLAARATLHHGLVDGAPAGPFDAATCLLALHFLPTGERRRTLEQIRRRLRPGAPLVTFHHSVPGGDGRMTWLKRHARFAAPPDVGAESIAQTAAAVATRLPLLTPRRTRPSCGPPGSATSGSSTGRSPCEAGWPTPRGEGNIALVAGTAGDVLEPSPSCRELVLGSPVTPRRARHRRAPRR